MELKNYILPKKRNLIFTAILLIIFLGFWWLDTQMIVSDAPSQSMSFAFILLPLGLVFLIIYPIPAYINAIIYLYTLQFLGALIAEIVYLYILANIILFIKDKIQKK